MQHLYEIYQSNSTNISSSEDITEITDWRKIYETFYGNCMCTKPRNTIQTQLFLDLEKYISEANKLFEEASIYLIPTWLERKKKLEITSQEENMKFEDSEITYLTKQNIGNNETKWILNFRLIPC